MKLTVVLGDVLEDARGCVLLDEVGGDEGGPLGSERGGEGAQAILAAGDEHERCAGLAGEPPGGGFADSAGGAGDDDDGVRGSGSCLWDVLLGKVPAAAGRGIGRLASPIGFNE